MDVPATASRKRFRDTKSVRVGVALFVVGSGPLLITILAAKLGITSDPNPNPVLFGMLAMLTFYPSLLLIFGGIISVAWQNRKRGKA